MADSCKIVGEVSSRETAVVQEGREEEKGMFRAIRDKE